MYIEKKKMTDIVTIGYKGTFRRPGNSPNRQNRPIGPFRDRHPRPLSCHESSFKIRNINIEKPARDFKSEDNKENNMDDVFTLDDLNSKNSLEKNSPETPIEKSKSSEINPDKIRLRRRRSMPTMRRDQDKHYQTLPLPKKYSKSKSDSKVVNTDTLDRSRRTVARANSVIEALTPTTLTRKKSIRKAKVLIESMTP